MVIATLVVIGMALAFLVLQWSDNFGGGDPVFIFYKRPYSTIITEHWGIYTRYGHSRLIGILLGIIAPLLLFAAAAFIALGAKWRS